jgi:hypothetical protein
MIDWAADSPTNLWRLKSIGTDMHERRKRREGLQRRLI